jgi:hypothetical protein
MNNTMAFQFDPKIKFWRNILFGGLIQAIVYLLILICQLLDPQEERDIVPVLGFRVPPRFGSGGTKFYRPLTEKEVSETMKAMLNEIHRGGSGAGGDAAST